jgi:hypothetical protein
MEMKQNNTTDFFNDITRGKVGEQIFVDDFLKFLSIEYEDVTDCQKFQVIDSDFLAKIGTYEIKTTYKDNNVIIIEEYTNINKELGKISLGWVYKTQADIIVFVSKKSRTMIFLPFTDRFKEQYAFIRDNTELIKNRISTKNNSRWQSAFRRVPFDMLTGFISVYKKLETNQ